MMDIDHTDSSSSSCSEMTEAMTRQSLDYAVSDYLTVALSELRQQGYSDATAQAFLDDAVDCRHKMIQWMGQIVDYCHFTSETTEIAINCLDRFVASSPEARRLLLAKHRNESDRNQCRQEYQLAAVACLYTVVKVHEPQCLSPTILAKLSQGMYQPRDVERMERRVLNALKWRVHLPTTSSCINQLISGLECFDETMAETCAELAKYQVELAWGLAAQKHPTDVYTISTMTLAAAAVQNSLESLGFAVSSPLVNDETTDAVQETLLLLLAADSGSGKMPMDRSRLVYSPATVMSNQDTVKVNSACFRHSPRSSIIA
jgi:Cyclin, N-terminal domain